MCIAGAVATLIGVLTEASPTILLALMLVYALAIPADFGRPDLGNVGERETRVPRSDDGPAFDRGLWIVGGRWLGVGIAIDAGAA